MMQWIAAAAQFVADLVSDLVRAFTPKRHRRHRKANQKKTHGRRSR